MRYDWNEALAHSRGSEGYFKEIDVRFLAAAQSFVPTRYIPFDALIPYGELGSKDVLEVGVGQGTHAQLLASHARSFVGIDLTADASRMTARRLALFGIPGAVVQMDAERMGFRDGSFDYVWSWGVVHQSADTRRVLAEIHRVLRPGGRCTVMIYYRSWWNYYLSGLLRAASQGQWRKIARLHHISQSATDGAIARYYKPGEWRAAAHDLFAVDAVEIFGQKSDLVLLPAGQLKRFLMNLIPDVQARFMTRQLRMGSLLVAHMRKANS
jgi:SAM-dependent methyltransferase